MLERTFVNSQVVGVEERPHSTEMQYGYKNTSVDSRHPDISEHHSSTTYCTKSSFAHQSYYFTVQPSVLV